MTDSFDKDYWDTHWRVARRQDPGRQLEPNPYLVREIGDLAPGTALDAGCGEGGEAVWLANEGWQVIAADISADVLVLAAERASRECSAPERVEWVEADLRVWDPATQFDLVTTQYAHPAMPQLEFYDRLAGWVAPGGTLLIVGHLHTPGAPAHGPGHSHHPPEEVSVTAANIALGLDATEWDIVTADETSSVLANRGGRAVRLDDVVVRATRVSRDTASRTRPGSPDRSGRPRSG